MLDLFFDGLVYGVWFLGAMIPGLLLLLAIGWGIYRFTMHDVVRLEDFMEDFPPEIPTRGPEPEYRFVPSTIVRPPNIKARKDEDDDDKS